MHQLIYLENFDIRNLLYLQEKLKVSTDIIIQLSLNIMKSITEDFSETELKAVLDDLKHCKRVNPGGNCQCFQKD